MAGSEEFISIVQKLGNNKFDVITRQVDFGNGQIVNQAYLLNKDLVKNKIAENKELFATRLGLSKNTTVDEIYQNILSTNGNFLKSAGLALSGLNDLAGIVLGYPRTDSLIFELEMRSPRDIAQERYHKDLSNYKKKLIDILYSENSPYKNMSDEFKADLAEKINSITEIKSSKNALGVDVSEAYPFVSYVEDPIELQQIRTNLDKAAENLDNMSTPKTQAKAEARAEASAQTKFNDYESKIKEANLDNIETQRQALQVFETKYPSTKGIPGRVNSLKELQKLINSPEYLKMDEVQRQIAELLILKSNQRLDIRDLYNDLNLSVDVKRQISIFDKCLKDGGINTVAGIYKQEDFDTLIMIAKARGVEDSVIEQMSAVFKKAQANGCMLVNNTPIDTSKAPTKAVTKNGQDYNVKVIDLSDPDVYANPEKYGLPAGTTPENIRLTVHMNDGFNKAPGREIHRLKNSDDLNLSGTITDGNNTLYGNQQVGVGLKYDQGSVSYASNYPAGTGFSKDINALANGRLNFDTPSVATFVRDRFIQRMKEQGFNISIEDYANFSKQFQGKSFSISDLSSLAKNGKININGKEIPLEIVQKTLADSTDDMMKVSYELRGKTITNGMNEINIENPEISYIYVRANSADETLESILSPETLKYAQDNNITIVFQKPNTLTNTDAPKASASRAETPKAETQASSTSSQSQRKTGFGLESDPSSSTSNTKVHTTDNTKFGTPENPNFDAMFSANTREDLEEALDLLEKVPDTNPLKKTYKGMLENKLAKLPKPKVLDKATLKQQKVDIKELAKSEKGFDFKAKSFDKTEIVTTNGTLSPEDIGFGNWTGGYSTKTNIDVVDIRNHAVDGNVHYNDATNSTIIYIPGKQEMGYPRPFDSLIRIQGQVSAEHAEALVEYLEKNVPNFKGKTVKPADVQRHTAEFFNNLSDTPKVETSGQATQASASTTTTKPKTGFGL